MFVDYAKIELKAGDGGNGAVAFRREKYEPMGGPAGGDGGNGGNIIFKVDERKRTLMDFKYKRIIKADNGENGRNKNRFGKNAEDIILNVPKGTIIRDEETNRVIADLVKIDQEFVIAKGGRGGRGNTKFKSSTRRSPRFAEPGRKGEELTVILELKLIADVGLVGFPNVGKSTLLSKISSAKPKIDNYHFTTLKPNLGVVHLDDEKSFVVADIPGLIEGASKGTGLGHDFLRHIERTKILAHVIDASGFEGRDPLEDFNKINKELRNYSEILSKKKQIIVLNKIDIIQDENQIQNLKNKFDNKYDIYEISAISGKNLKELLYKLYEEVLITEDEVTFYEEVDYKVYKEKEVDTINVRRENDKYIADGYFLERLVDSTNFSDYESLKHFQKVLKDKKVIERLEKLGAKEGDTVSVCGIEFDYIE
ncbi:MAG: GTPase ObgE [Bacillota bacterium]|nr:GTPase ObgE [Bacillota bacterium]